MKQALVALVLTGLLSLCAADAGEAAEVGAEETAEDVTRKMLDAIKRGDADTVLECMDLETLYNDLRRTKGDAAPSFDNWLEHTRLTYANPPVPGRQFEILGSEERGDGMVVRFRTRHQPDEEWSEEELYFAKVDGRWKVSVEPEILAAQARRAARDAENLEELRARYVALGRRIQVERQRIARRGPEFNLAEFVTKTETALEPPFKHDRVIAPTKRPVTDRYTRTRITFMYRNKSIADILKYLQAIEDPKHGVRVQAMKLAADDEGEQTTVTMTITFSVVTSVPGLALDLGAADDDVADEAADLEALRQMIDQRTAELTAFAGERMRPVSAVLRELAKICHGGKLPSEAAEEPVDAAADMAPFLKPSGPWGVHVATFQMEHGRVLIEGSAVNYKGVNELRQALEASPLFKEAKLKGSRPVGERTTLKMWLYLEEPQQAE